MNKQLVLSALGPDQSGLVNKITHHILEQGLNIEDSRMSVLGGEFAIMLLLSGDQETLNNLVAGIPDLSARFNDMIFNTRFTEKRNSDQPMLSYKVEVLALDHKGIVHNLARFFSERNINIHNLDTSSYAAPHTGSKMFSVSMTLSIPANTSINQLRDAFIDHCDNLNLDASFEANRK